MSLYVILLVWWNHCKKSGALMLCLTSFVFLFVGMVGLPGLEPGMTESKPVVLPITP